MKINIWVHKRDIESGKITDFYNICPQQRMWKDWFQIEVDQDTFVQLQEEVNNKRMNIIGQNGNDGLHYDKGDEDIDIGESYDDQPFGD
tara:strand:- start:190 stop:456 length:267 start_codon:yes stop_codon:yes gene_type:complete